MRTIVITDLDKQTAPTATIPEPKLVQKGKLLDCIKIALLAIGDATLDLNPDHRRLAIIEYNASVERALDSGVRPSDIRKKCEASYLRCLVACLQGVACATVDGNEDRRDQMADWYEDDRQRMIDAGFTPFSVDARANQRVWKGIR